jgi:uncharacterized protein
MKSTILFKLALVCLLQAIGLFGVRLWAAEVEGLYQATVPVESREDERQRSRAFAAALRQVLSKLTGHDEVLDNPTIQEALRAPQAYVETWTYRTEQLPASTVQALAIEVVFFPAEIQRLLNNAVVALWPPNRPETLVWLVVQDTTGARSFVDPSTGELTELLAALQAVAKQRGVPLAAPLLDFDDQRVLRPDQLWDFDLEAIRLASSRYSYTSILAIRVLLTPGTQVMAKTVHLFRDQVQEHEALDIALPDFMTASIALAARQLADNYSVRLSTTEATPTASLMLTIDGVAGLNDYAAVLAYLDKVPGISDLQMREVNGDKLTFSLNAVGQVRQLQENLALDRRLQPQVDANNGSSGLRLYYRWQAL